MNTANKKYNENRTTNVPSSLFLMGLVGLAFVQQACDTPSNATSQMSITAEVDEALMTETLLGVGSNVILPTLQQFETEVDSLEISLQELEDVLGTPDQDTALRSSQTQWKQAMRIWQELEVMQVGPAGSELNCVSGQSIRDSIYSWPTVNTCRVDQNTAAENWNDTSYYDDNLVNAYGLDAIEHMLFGSMDTECPAQVNPIADGSWVELGEQGILANRVTFALSLISEIQAQIQTLKKTWAPEQENFGHYLLADVGSPYQSQDQALNAIYDSLFYLETATKDRKLAQPLGLNNCNDNRCPDDFEGLLSQSSLSSVIGNLNGFKKLFMGGEGAGMDDLLTELGHGDLSEEIIRDTDGAIEKLEDLQRYVQDQNISITDLLTDEPERIEEAYESLALVTTNLKYDLATVLQMEIPREAAGDND